ncbi:MAG TPA: SpoIIE family protein phosphatase [Terriglobia bacterium]|nr:SpoIIE family protein phosphatase [Terriglobia bacterium]
MPKLPSLPKPLLVIIAGLFAGATILYSAVWMYDARWRTQVELGFDERYVASGHYELILRVYRDSPAQKAGLEPHDRILKIDGRPLTDGNSLGYEWEKHKPGDSVELTIQRAGSPAPFVVTGILRAASTKSSEGAVQQLGEKIAGTYPVAFLVVGLAVLFLRLEDSNAWLLALLFAGFIAIPNFVNNGAGLTLHVRGFALAYRALFDNLFAALFFVFFAVFPTRSPLDRRVPWLKWAALVVAAGMVPLPYGRSRLLILPLLYVVVGLGFVSLIWNALSANTPEARRKIRVLLWGTVVGVVPAVTMLGANDFLGFRAPLWLLAVVIVLLWLFPLSFAYAVVKHRVLEIPVLLKRSARYLLVQRGFLFLHVSVSVAAAVLFAWGLSHTHLMTPVGLTGGVAFGSVLALGGLRIQRAASERIDRAFFRNAYDARLIMEDLAQKARTVTDRGELAALLEEHLNNALRPCSLVIYLESSDQQLVAARGQVPAELVAIPTGDAALAAVARHGRPWEVSADGRKDTSELSVLSPLQPDCLVPMLGRDGRLAGLLVLGARLSEEPYAREDKQLLASVASQAALALESIRLAQRIAERMEVERRAAQEMEYAKEVQAKLFPQKLPHLAMIEYAGHCIQARQVGGDYYDFLSLASGRMGMVLADIAGKGIAGALLMANLQANLRSQYALALENLPQLLKSVNQLFYENTDDHSYATLFFGDYDDSTRRLRYVNCGHLPPLLLRADEKLERLTATATVLGLFESWECAADDVMLVPGDTLVLYTDGVTEAANADGEEFGECRLIETLRAHGHLPAASLLQTIETTVQQFSPGEQADDITVVVARCTA